MLVHSLSEALKSGKVNQDRTGSSQSMAVAEVVVTLVADTDIWLVNIRYEAIEPTDFHAANVLYRLYTGDLTRALDQANLA